MPYRFSAAPHRMSKVNSQKSTKGHAGKSKKTAPVKKHVPPRPHFTNSGTSSRSNTIPGSEISTEQTFTSARRPPSTNLFAQVLQVTPAPLLTNKELRARVNKLNKLPDDDSDDDPEYEDDGDDEEEAGLSNDEDDAELAESSDSDDSDFERLQRVQPLRTRTRVVND
jgi:hypothetical protein